MLLRFLYITRVPQAENVNILLQDLNAVTELRFACYSERPDLRSTRPDFGLDSGPERALGVLET